MPQSLNPPPPGQPPVVQAGGVVVPQYREMAAQPVPGVYATPQDLMEISIPDNARNDYSPSSMTRWLSIASRYADSFIGQRWLVPLQKYSDAWVWAICEIAFVGMVGKNGYDPEAKTERTFNRRREMAEEWIKAARDYEITPDPRLVKAEPAHVAQMVSDVPRGWNPGRGGCLPGRGRGGSFF